MKYVLTYDEAPPSNNAGGGGTRQNKYQANRIKQQWEGIYAVMLMAGRVPKNLRYVTASVELQFVKHNTRRDPTNYYQAIAKPLADAMAKGGWIPDDTDDYFEMLPVRISKDKLTGAGSLTKSRMVITLEVTT